MIHMIEEYAAPQRARRPAARADRRRRGGVSATDSRGGRTSSRGVKFSIRQILASTVGAVIAAVIASTFGVKGTVVGVAIGSAAATFGTALVAQSIERGQEAVKQVVVRAPDSSTLLRKLGSTVVSGDVDVDRGGLVSAGAAGAARGDRARGDLGGDLRFRRVGRGPPGPPPPPPSGSKPPPCRCRRRDRPGPAGPVCWRRFSWKTIAGTAAIVFVIALLFVTAIELISGKPLSADLRQRRHRDQRARHLHAVAVADAVAFAVADDNDDNHVLDHVDDHPAQVDVDHDSTTSTSTTPAPKAPTGSSTTTSTTAAGSSSTTTTPGVGATTTTSHQADAAVAAGAALCTGLRRVVGIRACLPALELGRAALHEAGDALLGVERVGEELLAHGLVVERGGTVDVEGAVGQPLGDPDRLGGTLGQPAGELLERRLELGPGHQPVDEPDPVGLGGRAHRRRRRTTPWPSGSPPGG